MSKKIVACAICLALSLMVLGGCSSSSTSSKTVDQSKAYAAYNELCNNYINKYGTPSSMDYYSIEYGSGLTYARLIDMDNDGYDELILSYTQGSNSYPRLFEVWIYKNDELSCAYSGTISSHETNGWFPFMEVAKRADGNGYVIYSRLCEGSAPYVSHEQLIGFEDGKSTVLADRCLVEDFTTQYFEGDYSKGTEITESRYTQLFKDVIGDNSAEIHDHLFSSKYSIGDCSTGSLEDTLSMTKETLQKLADSSK